MLAARRTLRSRSPPRLCYGCRSGLSPGCRALRRSRCNSRCYAFSRGPPGVGLLSCSSPAIPRLVGIRAFWQRKACWLPHKRARCCSAGDTLFPLPFPAGCWMTAMLWPDMSAALLIWRDMCAAAYRPLLAVLFVLLRFRGLWPSARSCHHSVLVKSKPLQCDSLP